jgi:hypothetical protein
VKSIGSLKEENGVVQTMFVYSAINFNLWFETRT